MRVSRVPPRPAILLIAGAVLLPLCAASCGDEPSPVALGTAARTTVAENVEVPGSVTARAAATLTAPADGTLAELRVEAGDRVRKGQVVAVVDSPGARRRLADATQALDATQRGGVRQNSGRADFAAAQHRTDRDAHDAFEEAREAAAKVTDPALRTALLTQIRAAERQYAAASKAVTAAVRSVQNGVSGLGQAVNAMNAAQRLQAQQAYDLAASAVEALTVRATVAGVVQLGGSGSGGGASLTDLLSGGAGSTSGTQPGSNAPGSGALPGVDTAVPRGAAVRAGTPLVTIVDTGQLGLVADVDETDVLLVKPGTPATVELEAATGAEYRATVQAIDVLPTTSARGGVSYRVRMSLAKGKYDDGRAAPSPRPGMSAVVRLQVRQATDAVTVPASAVFTAEGQDAVWAVRGGKAQRVPVTVGVQGDDVVQIVSGVDGGEQIVVGGTDEIRSGQQVQ